MIELQKICSKCVLPESKPDIFLDVEGVCNICRDFEKTEGDSEKNV